MREENLLMLPAEELPQTDEPKKKQKVNCLQDMLLDLMNERGSSLAEIQKETGIPWGTLYGWFIGDVNAQKADMNLLKLAKYFNVSLHYLCFGIGDDTKVFEDEENRIA